MHLLYLFPPYWSSRHCPSYPSLYESTSVGFAASVTGTRYVPAELRNPRFLIYGRRYLLSPEPVHLRCQLFPFVFVAGHKSMIRTVHFHPFEPYILTAGIERDVLVHSPSKITPACGDLVRTPRQVRKSSSRSEDRHAQHPMIPSPETLLNDADIPGS